MPRARRLRSFATGAVLVAFIAGLAYFLWPSSLGGCSTLTIVSGQSMEPTYSTGDLVWSRCGEPSVGDVVVYSPADTGGAQVIHRIVGGDSGAGWTLQGDNNDFLDPWNPDNSQIAGIATVHIPQLGSILYSLGNPYIWGSLIILAAAFFLWPGPGPGPGPRTEPLPAQKEGVLY
ncbi:S24/S26 family peptidase [Arthrobacter sp. Helios]|uniref:S24/S26 family peptidase n=1 Tax=Arthrobacter sp. Helios TaxID=2828862 RepID=UPI00204B938A|nr:S24/S26 family peptidase [Arthrobacter sp. Helios]UPO77246.1 S24/S26 family peptidase [Arthrobacter sp. Helios]